jgi:hypothetical protein
MPRVAGLFILVLLEEPNRRGEATCGESRERLRAGKKTLEGFLSFDPGPSGAGAGGESERLAYSGWDHKILNVYPGKLPIPEFSPIRRQEIP